MKRVESKVAVSAKAIALAALLGIAVHAPPPQVQGSGESAVSQQTSPTGTRQQPPPDANRQTMFVRQRKNKSGPGYRAHNPMRQLRRRLERMGVITSGRQWRQFRKMERTDPDIAWVMEELLKALA